MGLLLMITDPKSIRSDADTSCDSVSDIGSRGTVKMSRLGIVIRYSAMLSAAAAALSVSDPAHAALVSACTGVSLPPSVVTNILAPVLHSIVKPIENTVNPILGSLPAIPILGPIIGATVKPLTLNVDAFLASAAAGNAINLDVLDVDGHVVSSGAQCDTIADSLTLKKAAGIAIGGNKITGLGATGKAATSVDIDAIAFGNNASANIDAVKSIALGSDAAVTVANSVALGAGSTAGRGASSYTALGVTGQQVSFGEVSVGKAGGERQITNVAAGSAMTDAVNVSQLVSISAAANNAVQYDLDGFGNKINKIGLKGAAAGTVAIQNLSDGAVNAASTDAVNGRQLSAVSTRVDTNTTNIAGNTSSITNLSNGINDGTVGLVRQIDGAPGSGVITVGASTGGTVVNIAGTSGSRTLTGVAAGAAVTDAVNFGQLTAVTTVAANAVQYDLDGQGNRTGAVTLTGVAGGNVAIRNVADGAVSAASTDAVNGRQLFAVATETSTNTTNILNLTNGTAGLVQQAGGSPGTGRLSVGATTGGTVVDFTGTSGTRTLSGITAGVAQTDAVNVSQLSEVGTVAANSVQYDVDGQGVRTNKITLTGGNAAAPVTIGNVAAGALSATSSEAVNGAQLFATNTQVNSNTTNIANNTTAITDLSTSINNGTTGLVRQTGGAPGTGVITVGAATGGTVVNVSGTDGARVVTGVAAGVGATDAVNVAQLAAVGQASLGAVQYDRNLDGSINKSSVTLNTGGTPGTIGNVAAGVRQTDAVNVGQLQSGLASTLDRANTYTDSRINALSFDINRVAKRAYAGTAASMALQAPIFAAPGQVAMRVGSGLYRGEYAMGASLRATADNGRWSVSTGVSGGPNSGVAATAGIDFVLGH
jgi:YD repeat-containing protein